MFIYEMFMKCILRWQLIPISNLFYNRYSLMWLCIVCCLLPNKLCLFVIICRILCFVLTGNKHLLTDNWVQQWVKFYYRVYGKLRFEWHWQLYFKNAVIAWLLKVESFISTKKNPVITTGYNTMNIYNNTNRHYTI